MHPPYPYFLSFYIQKPVLAQRKVVLGNLVPFGKIWVKVIFPVELGFFRYSAFQSQPGFYYLPDSFLVYNRKGSRMPHANGADIQIRAPFSRIV